VLRHGDGVRDDSPTADAITDLRQFGAPEYLVRSRSIATLILRSERFYFPDGAYILEGRKIDNDVKSLMRLPSDAISILWDCDLHDENGNVMVRVPAITVAIDQRSKLNDELRIVKPEDGIRFTVFSVVRSAEERRWLAYPAAASFMLNDGDGYTIRLHAEAEVRQLVGDDITKMTHEFQNDVSVVMNLCALLGTKVARAETITPPRLLNKSRAASSKTLLPDYHVLKVGDEIWDKPIPGPSGGGHSVRSHFRRGHIRRLDEGKFTWVRHTIVTGNRPGFVDKEYHV
jgi:hypothetical protein